MANTTLRAYLDELNILLGTESFEEVMGHCRHILQHFPRNVETYRTLGRALLEKRRFDEAKDVFQRVLAVLPDDFTTHLALSNINEEEGQLPIAIWHLERAAEQDPGMAAAIHDEIKRLIEKRDGTPPAHIAVSQGALAHMYARGGLYEQALTELQSAIQTMPERVDLQLLLADVLWDSERYPEAAEVALQVLEKLPNSLAANRIMASLWLETERPSDAAPFLTRLEQVDPFAAWETVYPDGRPLPPNAFMLPQMVWDAKTAARMVNDAPDWVSSIGDVFSTPDSMSLSGPTSNWLEQGTPGSSTPAFAAPSSQDFQMPDWFGDAAATAQGATPAQEELPAWFEDEAPAAPAQQISPSTLDAAWLEDDSIAQQLPSGFTDLLSGSESIPTAPASAVGDMDMPSWLGDADSTQASSEPAAADAMSWLMTGPLPSLDEEAAPAPEAAETTGSSVDALDWMQAEPEPPADLATDASFDFSGMGFDSEPAAEAPAMAADESDWMASSAQADTGSAFDLGTVEEASAPGDALDWLAGSAPSEEQGESSGVLDLSGLDLGETPAVEAMPTAGESPDWLTGTAPSEEQGESSGVLDLSGLDLGETPVVEATSTSGDGDDLDWLSGIGPSEEQGESSGVLDLSGLDLGETPAVEAMPTADESLDWSASSVPASASDLAGFSDESGLDTALDWMSMDVTGTDVSSGTAPDWMGQSAPMDSGASLFGEPAAAPQAEPEAQGDPLGWMRGIDSGEVAAPAEPAAELEPEAEHDPLAWMRGFDSGEAAAPAEEAATDLGWASTAAEPAAELEPEAEHDPLVWMSGFDAGEPAAPAEESAADLGGLDWMSAESSGQESLFAEEDLSGEAEDWQRPASRPISSARLQTPDLEQLNALSEAGSTASPEAGADWLDMGSYAEEAQSETPPTSGTPDWMMDGSSARLRTADIPGEFVPASDEAAAPAETPDWLTSMAPADSSEGSALELDQLDFSSLTPAEPASTELDQFAELGETEVVAEGDSWLSQLAPQPDTFDTFETVEEPPAGDDWMATYEPTPQPDTASSWTPSEKTASAELNWDNLFEATEAAEATDITDFTEAEEAPSFEETSAVAGGMPDWLAGMTPVEASAGEESFDNLDFSQFGTAEAEPSAASAAAGDMPDWLASMTPVSEGEAEPAAPAVGETEPDWLASMAPTGTEVTAAPERPVMESSAEDWLSLMEEPEAAAAEEPTQAAAPTQVVQPPAPAVPAIPGARYDMPSFLPEIDFSDLPEEQAVAQAENLVNTSSDTEGMTEGAAGGFKFSKKPAWMRKDKAAKGTQGTTAPNSASSSSSANDDLLSDLLN